MYQYQSRCRPIKHKIIKDNVAMIKMLDLKEILLIITIILLIINIIVTINIKIKLSENHKVLLDNVEGITNELKKDTIVIQPETECDEDKVESEIPVETPIIETPTESQETNDEIRISELYSDFTPEEIYMIQRCVETETYGADIYSKMNVVSVIFNRLNDPNKKYGESIIDIITYPNQFAYWRTEISDTTIEAIETVYRLGDTTNGCIAFRSDKHPKEWCGWKLQFVDDVGHGFYK